MTLQSELTVWRQLPPERRRRLVSRLCQMAARQLKTARPAEVGNETPGHDACQRQDPKPPP